MYSNRNKLFVVPGEKQLNHLAKKKTTKKVVPEGSVFLVCSIKL
jgi:hypothetical protein